MVRRRVAAVDEHISHLGDQPVFWRSAPGAPVLYVHGAPTSSELWLPFLERTGGVAVDLPGFGRSGKRGDLDFSIEGYGAFLDAFAPIAGLDDEVRVVVHGWGAVALPWAARRAERVERLAIVDAVPLLPGHRWRGLPRLWQTRFAGEVAMGFMIRPVVSRLSRRANVTPGPLPREIVDDVAAHLDQGTQRATLRLFRSATSEELAEAGEGLGELDCPALIVWGQQDPYVPAHFARAYAEALGGETTLECPEDAGHFPWLDRPGLIGRLSDFVSG
jgi:pimeloyl-ACP methyl ester carboxylesterase